MAQISPKNKQPVQISEKESRTAESTQNNTKLTYLLLAAVMSVVAPLATVQSALAARSGLNLDSYCKAMYQTRGMSAWAQLNGNTVYNWACAQRQPNGQVKQYGINTGHVCAVQRGTWDTGFTNYNNPYSWYCGR